MLKSKAATPSLVIAAFLDFSTPAWLGSGNTQYQQV
jgi:hypothetical protein